VGLSDFIKGASADILGFAGESMMALSENPFWKADRSEGGLNLEDQERAPGGDQKDTPESAPPPDQPADADPKTLFWDPFSIIEQLGYKERPSSISYYTLRAMVWKSPIIQAVINTRLDQMAAFCKPSRSRYDMGFKWIRRNEPYSDLTPAERKWGEQMDTIMLRTGVTDNPRGRDNFETFTRKFMWDSLVFDQGTFEIVQNRVGQPAEWYATDGSTMRLADSASVYMNEDTNKSTRYVQIYDGMIITEYTQEELCFAVRNPRTDMRLYGYGVSELEMLINIITALLYAFEYNQRAFSQGSVHKGILNFKGAIPDKQLKAFRRHWYQMLSGVENAWRTPITNAEDLQWISMHMNARDMEFPSWYDFLIKQACSMYKMDPIEINFKYGNVGQKGALAESSNKDKITESKMKGLLPLLRFFAEQINRHIIWPLNENMEITFPGLDALTKEESADLNGKRVKTTHTVNELRAEEGLDPIEGGDTLLDPTWAQQQAQAQQQAMAEEGGGFGGFGEEGEEEEGEEASDEDFRRLAAELEEDEEEEDEAAEAAERAERAEKGKPKPNLKKSLNGKRRGRYRVDVRL
jgi:hypothetical protein